MLSEGVQLNRMEDLLTQLVKNVADIRRELGAVKQDVNELRKDMNEFRKTMNHRLDFQLHRIAKAEESMHLLREGSV